MTSTEDNDSPCFESYISMTASKDDDESILKFSVRTILSDEQVHESNSVEIRQDFCSDTEEISAEYLIECIGEAIQKNKKIIQRNLKRKVSLLEKLERKPL